MRIISGKFKGRIITPPNNLRARPTTDFAKENLFNVLANACELENAEVLDLFSGTGSISFEFISRGALSVTSVELNTVHYNFIKSTAVKLGMDNLYPVKANAFLYIKSCKRKFDIIFADPPYDLNGSETLPDLIFENELLNEEGILIMEHSKNINYSKDIRCFDTRSYGSVNFSFFKK
ncbi:MAG: 16S rRNA (guanine(966)-N(2))-methyltransferase RsmD [Rikenellaceae bacterium]|nr:16S rRNA (guanine(966)-N(2))-methyltransferase RsmD [Rikenellaceae bacterium]